MANRRVVLERTGQKTAVVDPPTSTPARQANKKRQHQQPNANKNQQPTTNKRQRKQGVTSRSGAKSRPDPENVIVIDSADEEEPEAELAAKQPTARPETTAKSSEPSASRASMESLDSDDYFEVLGLSRSATDADIKKAYRKLAIQWHPDKNRENPQAEEYFKRIAEAYEVLSDPEKRRQFERYGKQGASGSGPSSSDGFADAHYSGFSSRHARDIFEAFFGGGDPFEAFFNASGPRAGRSGRHRSRHAMMDPFGDDNDFGFGGMPSMMSMMGGFGGGFGRSPFDDPFFSGHGAFGGGGGSFSSQSVSSSSYTDRNGHVVTTKTTTTTTPEGRTETVTEEYRNGKLTHSSSSSNGTSRLAGAGRLHLEGGTRTNSSSRRGRRQ